MWKALQLLLMVAFLGGCASSSYNYGTHPRGGDSSSSPPMQQQVFQGAPSPWLDHSDWIWPGSLLAKLILWNPRVDSHQISAETVDEVRTYLDKNGLQDVQLLVNTYKPGNQWSRLFRNGEVGAVWRYTLGILSTSLYTILPGRFFGGDHYNPYTNTIHLYSDDFAIALHEAAHAKDFNSRKHKGLHGALYTLPGAPLYYEAVASSDTLSYLEYECRYAEEKQAYRVLHPAYGTYVGGTFLRQTGFGFLAAIPGHITGAIASRAVDDDQEREIPEIAARCAAIRADREFTPAPQAVPESETMPKPESMPGSKTTNQ